MDQGNTYWEIKHRHWHGEAVVDSHGNTGACACVSTHLVAPTHSWSFQGLLAGPCKDLRTWKQLAGVPLGHCQVLCRQVD
jgi:hypothetical protein